jgi:hypothetical protein
VPSARPSSFTSKPDAKSTKGPGVFRKGKRPGGVTVAEKELVAQFVLDQPCEITPSQTNALSRVLRRSKELTRSLIEEARENFQSSASHYVEVHKQAVDTALANGDAKSLSVAVEGSQWALESMGADGVRIVDKPTKDKGISGPRILIGVAVGGIKDPQTVVSIPAHTSSVVDIEGK